MPVVCSLLVCRFFIGSKGQIESVHKYNIVYFTLNNRKAVSIISYHHMDNVTSPLPIGLREREGHSTITMVTQSLQTEQMGKGWCSSD